MIGIYDIANFALRLLPPEAAHRLVIRWLRSGLIPGPGFPEDPILATRLWDTEFRNPIGLAAGFDKHIEAPAALLKLGFGFVEMGSITPLPQAGNPRPRVFRLARDGAVINRLGFNSAGHAPAVARLTAARRGGARYGVVGVNLGANAASADFTGDYAAGVAAFAKLADYLVVNISSPNTPGLRDMQREGHFKALIDRVYAARDAAGSVFRLPILVKIAPDLAEADKKAVADIALTAGIDGLIVSNTTVARPAGLTGRHRGETGGLSGRPLFAPSTALLADMYRLTGGRVPLIGCGGVASGADAYAKILAGASLVELYTAVIYQGPGLIGRIKRDLAALLRRDGHASVAAAVGAGMGAGVAAAKGAGMARGPAQRSG